MLEPDQQYLFASVRVPSPIAEELANAQRDIAQTLKEKEHRHKLLPRRMFLLPIFNLRKVPRLSDEAIVLAVERLRADLGPINVAIAQLEGWPSPDNVEQIVARVEDENDELAAMRNQLSDALAALGFEVDDGEWSPIIPLIRLSNTQESPAFDFNMEMSENLKWSVTELELLGRPTNEQRARFQVRSRVRLTSTPSDSAVFAPIEDEQRNEIASLLESRITQRRSRLSESRRTERAKNLRVEDDTTEPQHPDESDD